MTLELITATKNGDLAAVRELIAQGIDPTFHDEEGRNPLHYAVLEGKDVDIKTLVKDTAHYIELITYKGQPSRNYAPIVSILIESGFDCNAQDNYGYTPLLYAARCNNEEAAISLIKAGAPVPKNNKMLDNFLARFEEQDLQNLVTQLEAAGCPTDNESEATLSGQTLLLTAAEEQIYSE